MQVYLNNNNSLVVNNIEYTNLYLSLTSKHLKEPFLNNYWNIGEL